MKNIYATTDKKHTAILFSKDMVKKYLRIYPNATFKTFSDIYIAFEKTKPNDYNSPKIFAIKKGLVKGLFFTSAEYQRLLNGIANGKGKKCKNIEAAYQYIYSKNIPKNLTKSAIKQPQNVAYVDGSYSDETNTMGIAYLLQCKGNSYSHSSFIKLDTKGSSVIAELFSAMLAIDRAIKEGLKEITIVHDNEQIQSILKSEKQLKGFNQKYYDFINTSSKLININFKKIKSHSGNEYNNAVDRLARQYNLQKFINMLTTPPT